MKSLSLFSLKGTVVLFAFIGLLPFSGIAQTSKKCSCDSIFYSLPTGAKDSVLRWVSKGLSQKFLCTALAAPASRSDLFIRLTTAKSIYNQRIIVKDYKHIPGLNHEPFQANNLSAVAVSASVYGISDTRYDLPSFRTSTFTDTTFLTLIPGGTILYRVTDAGGEAGGGKKQFH